MTAGFSNLHVDLLYTHLVDGFASLSYLDLVRSTNAFREAPFLVDFFGFRNRQISKDGPEILLEIKKSV